MALKKFTLAVDGQSYSLLKAKMKSLGYINVQELIRDIIRERLEKSELEKLGQSVERKIKKYI